MYEQFPGMQKVITPQVAVDSIMQLASLYHTSRRLPPHLYGYHYPNAWTKYLNTVYKLGQTKTQTDDWTACSRTTWCSPRTPRQTRPAPAGTPPSSS